MKIIQRNLQAHVEKWLFRGKIIIIYGARQVGKTTMVKDILRPYADEGEYINCEILSILQVLESGEPLRLKQLFGNKKLIILDEAQNVPGIGQVLKLLHDTYPEIQIIATGSSSFHLSGRISEPLTGRALEFVLFPFSYEEFGRFYSKVEQLQTLPFILRFGLYPEMAEKSEDEARFLIDNLTSKYLFRDIFAFEQVKKPLILSKLLQVLAFQIGSEVSTNELAMTAGVARKTVDYYIDLLEKSFVIFRLTAFSRNLRSEINKKFKVYFYDLGIRNSVVSAFNDLEMRNDLGQLWENFCIVERMKYLQKNGLNPKKYFWRTHGQQEIDYLEENNGKISAFEFKYSSSKAKFPVLFDKTYPGSSFEVITRENFQAFIE